MNAFGRLTRVTDLFVEGVELPLGDDDEGKPVVVWIKKLNSFEDAEARKDGMAARAARILALKATDNPDRINVEDQIDKQPDEWVRDQVVQSYADEDYLRAMDDVEADPEWHEKLDGLRRMDTLLREGDVPEGDPRWAELSEQNGLYLEAVNAAVVARAETRKDEVSKMPVEEVREKFLDLWMERQSSDDWVEAKQVTEVYYALRDCQATQDVDGRWIHTTCNHGRRLLDERSQVRELPQEMLVKVVAAIRKVTLNERESGNSDAPTTSSESSEPQSVPGA